MHQTAPFALMSVAMASRSAIIEAPDDTCGYLNGMKQAPFGCHNLSEKCAIYYPTSSMAAPSTLLPMITPAPQPSVICYEPSRGDCTVQPTACVDGFEDCTGACSKDPLTLKCHSHLYCNRAHFESPLSFRNIMAMDSGLRSAVAPADGWFCGPPPSSIQRGDASHNKTASMSHIISSPVSISTTLDVTITLSKPGPGLGSSVRPSVSPTTTLSVTITLSRPGQTPGPSPLPSPHAATRPEDIDCETGTHSRDDCCLDEQDAAEACCDDWARQLRRQATDRSGTVDSPVAAPQDSASRGSAIVSTTYIGQTNRLPFIQATRPWNVVIPTAVATSTTTETTTAGPRRRPGPRKGKNNRLTTTRITCGSIFGFFIIIFVCWVWRKSERRSKPGPKQRPAQHENGQELVAHRESVPERRGRYCEHIDDLASITQQAIGMLGASQTEPDSRNTEEQPEGQPRPALGHPMDPALRRHPQVSFESSEATADDVDDPAPRSVSSVDDPAPQSEGSLEQEAYKNALGIRGLEESNRASNARRGRLVMF